MTKLDEAKFQRMVIALRQLLEIVHLSAPDCNFRKVLSAFLDALQEAARR